MRYLSEEYHYSDPQTLGGDEPRKTSHPNSNHIHPSKEHPKNSTPGCLDDIQVMLNTTQLSRGDSKEVGDLCLVGGGFKGIFFFEDVHQQAG